jgi:hypothetical protein
VDGWGVGEPKETERIKGYSRVVAQLESEAWVPLAEFLRILRDAPADPDLLDDLAWVREMELGDD